MESFDLTKDLIDSTKPLFIYVSALVILCFSLFLLFNENPHIKQLITGISAIIAFLLVLNLRALDPWLSLVIAIAAAVVFIWALKKESPRRLARRRSKVQQLAIGGLLGLFMSGNAFLFWYDYQNNIYGETIRVMLHTRETKDIDKDLFDHVSWEQKVFDDFNTKFGAKVEFEGAELDVNERLEQVKELLYLIPGNQPKEPIHYIDVFAIDVIWPKVLAEHAEDLNPVFEKSLKEKDFIDRIITNNKVNNKIVAVPWYVEAGLLFYRSNLLEKYGYYKPPQTWDELEDMAKKIQEGERAKGNKDFWGFIWQGKEYEGLTCNALEWQVSNGGGTLIDAENPMDIKVDIKDSATAAFERAKNWIWKDKITPERVLKDDDSKIFQTWLDGNAAFMRNWSAAYVASKELGLFSPKDFQVALLPKGNGANARKAATLGGWQLMINKYSQGKRKKAAIEFVKFLTDKDRQESLANKTGKLPTLKNLASTLANKPPNKVLSITELLSGSPKIEPIVLRPSTATGWKYPKISEVYSEKVHEILKDENSNVQELVEELRDEVQKLIQP